MAQGNLGQVGPDTGRTRTASSSQKRGTDIPNYIREKARGMGSAKEVLDRVILDSRKEEENFLQEVILDQGELGITAQPTRGRSAYETSQGTRLTY